MKRSKPFTAPFGSVSCATMRPEDLIPAFASMLDNLKTTRVERKLINEANALDFDAEDACEHAEDVLSELFDALDAHAPAYAYFGAHPGDGADYGFWLSEEWESNFDGLKVDDIGDVPKGFSGEVMQVSDHGNLTLYAYSRGRARSLEPCLVHRSLPARAGL